MATLTVSIPEKLKKEMDQHPDVNWAKYLGQKLEMHAKNLAELKKSGRI